MEEKRDFSGFVNAEEAEIEQIKERKMREMEERIKAKGEEQKEEIIDYPLVLSDATFMDAVRKSSLIVVDCWAPWCGPCKTIAPVIEELAKQYAGKVVFGKLNVDENPKVATDFAIMAIPTMFIFKNGEPVDVIQGALPKPYLEAKLKEWL